jgi:WD40 repeat protein
VCVTPDGKHAVMCVTPDGKHAVTKSDDKTARVWWSLKDGALQRELTGHSRAPGRFTRCA